MYCFKYRAPSDAQFGMLSRGEVFFASADEMNDGSECRPRYVLKGSADLWTRLAEMILIDTCCFSEAVSVASSRALIGLAQPLGNALKVRAGAADFDFDGLWSLVSVELPSLLQGVDLGVPAAFLMAEANRAYRRARNLLNEATYMASFSLDPCDPTMWGHYAGADRGFCIVFRAPERKLRIRSPFQAFHGCRRSEETGIVTVGMYVDAEVELQSVQYLSAPLRFNAFHRLIPHFRYSAEEYDYDVPLLLPGDAPPRHENRFGLVKAKTWQYEQEVRALLPSFGELVPEARCVRYDWSQVVGLVFGPRMSDTNMKRAIAACFLLRESRASSERRTEPFAFFQAQQQVDSFQMALSPIGVLGAHYSPGLFPFKPLHDADAATAAAVRETVAALNTAGQDQRGKRHSGGHRTGH